MRQRGGDCEGEVLRGEGVFSSDGRAAKSFASTECFGDGGVFSYGANVWEVRFKFAADSSEVGVD